MATRVRVIPFPGSTAVFDAGELVAKMWRGTWPLLGAVALFVLAWQVVVWSAIWPDYLLPGPLTVFGRLGDDLRDPGLYSAFVTTGTRALAGYSLAVSLGLAIGLAVSRSRVVRSAVGSLIMGLRSRGSHLRSCYSGSLKQPSLLWSCSAPHLRWPTA